VTHLPEFQLHDPQLTRAVTVRDLITHRTGLNNDNLLFWGTPLSRTELLGRVRYLPAAYPFRSRWDYNNLMYMTAGEVVRGASGMSWDDFLHQRIFAPSGMRSTTTRVTGIERVANRATPHAREGGASPRPFAWTNLDNIGPAGSVASNIVDMARWMRLQLGHGALGATRIFSDSVARQMHTPNMVMPAEGPIGEALRTWYPTPASSPTGSGGCSTSATAARSSSTPAAPTG
jgi:CubicO group peptidase (beta-lactamase class C family)